MARFLVALVLTLAAVALSKNIPDPSDLAFVLSENDFEDYLDSWLQLKTEANRLSTVFFNSQSGCTLDVNEDLGQPQPVYLNNNTYLTPTGATGKINLYSGEQVTIACPGSKRSIQHPNTAVCVNNDLVSGAGWLNGTGTFSGLTCSSHPTHEAVATNETCYNNNLVIRVGFTVEGVFYPLYWSCFDERRLEVLYVWYEQNPQNAVFQSGINRPNFAASTFYPGVPVDDMYKVATQKETIAELVGNDLANKYITNRQYLARGHLAAKTDFIYASGQRASFYFINVAPQWQPFNAGNWNSVEQYLRARIGQAGYNTVVYTGTFGVSQLRDENDRLVNVYLYTDANNNPQIPVPLYYYKVVYDAGRRLGTAFVSINNPYYTESEVRALTFCTDHCRNNSAFSWLKWQPDRIDMGYSFCCTVDDFRRTVPHLPAFTVTGLLS
ncbi:hypothetical protein HF086_012102 [Spodoptera exigua]|uniref:DNA/RNA non-specific endonuclease/pyrophosphatase/phosphodiesterase domain-containing protein n=1 Tax=Spodoptera exigua TaxID=7107 RepID=A0A922MAD6_SPOEX|nr:hypothetical protein HF086_012102 [Spodoptera exigua]